MYEELFVIFGLWQHNRTSFFGCPLSAMTLTKTSDVGFCLCIDVMFHNSISYPFTCQHRMFVHRVLRSRCAAFDCVVKNRCAAQAISFSCVNFALYIFQPKNIIHDLCEHENMINLTVWLALSFVVIFETGAARNRKDIIRNFSIISAQ